MRQSSSERRIRKLRAQYRKRIAIWAIVMLIIGLVLGVVADRLLLTPKDATEPEPVVVYITPEPTEVPEITAAPETEPTAAPEEDGDKAAADEASIPAEEDKAASAEDKAPEATPTAEPAKAAEEGKDYTISMEAPTDTPAPTPEPTPVPTDTPVPGPTTIAIVPFGETYDFSTQIKSDGTARITVEEGEPYETIDFSLTMKDYMLPSDFASKWGSVYKLQGTEAGAGFELTLNNYTGSATIVPQNIIKIVFLSEDGLTENAGFQLMDAEIAGQADVAVENDAPKMLWKRYTFSNADPEMEYLAVSTYNDGAVQTLLFELKSDIAPTPDPKELYTSLSRGTKSDAVTAMQKRLIELRYLDGEADGAFGGMTEEAVKKAQKDYLMEETGTATPEFQARLFSPDQPRETPEPTEVPMD